MLDDAGHALYSASLSGDTVGLAVCPGGGRSVDLASRKGRTELRIRALPTLEVVRQTPVDALEGVEAVTCGDIYGREVLASLNTGGDRRIVHLDGDGAWTGIWAGRGDAVTFTTSPPGLAIVAEQSSNGSALIELDLANGTDRRLPGFARTPSTLAPNPEGSWIAAFLPGTSSTSSDAAGMAGRTDGATRQTDVPNAGPIRAIAWTSDELVTLVRGAPDAPGVLKTYGLDLKLHAQWEGWPASTAVAQNGRLFGVRDDGRLISADPLAPGIVELEQVGRGVSLLVLPELTPETEEALRSDPPDRQVEEASSRRLSESGPFVVSGAVSVLGLVALVLYLVRRRRTRQGLS